MFTKPRRQRNLKRKILVCILLLGALGLVAFCLNTFLLFGKPLFISPLSKANTPDLVSVEKILKDKNISYTEVTSSNNSYLVSIQDNGQVILSQEKDISSQIASLQRILLQLTIEGKPFKGIDFRFLEPTISF